MQKLEVSGRLVKWAIELVEFDIHYRSRLAIKGQAATDFISELTPMKVVGESSELTPVKVVEESLELTPTKIVGVPSETGGEESGPGADKEMHIHASNNAAEYEALIGGLQLSRDIGVDRVEVFSDSQLVVNQVNGSFEAKEPQLNSYQALSKTFMQRFK
ncbi:PREDICTED: uncharacterized protein LOC101307062 [Fragaria vesca subsp. vesca]